MVQSLMDYFRYFLSPGVPNFLQVVPTYQHFEAAALQSVAEGLDSYHL